VISVDDERDSHKIRGDRIDLREQLFNNREIGPIDQVQLPLLNITQLWGVMYDLDPPIFLPGPLTPGADSGPEAFFERTVAGWLSRHPVLEAAEVRDTGRGLHLIIRFEEPVVFRSDGEREPWSGVVAVVQAILPIDPDQPGITAVTRPIGSINSKTGREVRSLKPGKPVPVVQVERLYDQMVQAPFRTVMGVLLGAGRVSPCPICQTHGSILSALEHVGQCYGSCGKVKLERIYDLFLAPRIAKEGEDKDADR
jgi:hypothetical protein